VEAPFRLAAPIPTWQSLQAGNRVGEIAWHLPNLKAGVPLGPLLYDKRLVGQFRRSGTLLGKKVRKLHEQRTEVIGRARRLHFKSLGGLLALQEEIARQWLARTAPGRVGNQAVATD
jgi:hypothetical protein